MAINDMILKIRSNAKLSQEQFAELFGVSRQSVQKWENGSSSPELDKLIKIAKYFDVSLDAILLGNDARMTEILNYNKQFKPKYEKLHIWESYSSDLPTEYQQSIEEGLDIAAYENIFTSIAQLPAGEIKKKFGDILFEVVTNAKTVENYKYIEPSTLDEIKSLRSDSNILCNLDKASLPDKVYGALLGRICGCLLGQSVEGVRTNEFIPFLKETGNYPLHRYIQRSDLNDDILSKYRYPFASRRYADEVNCMPADDDTNYIILAQQLIETYGRDFTSKDVSRVWISLQSKDAYCTAERVAFCNFIKGYEPPESAKYKNPYREWIGAQIRGDYFGYINPGNPELAAEMAFRDASISHIKNGIYGEMFVSAMIAIASGNDNIKDIILGGLAQIPHTSRLYEAITHIINEYESGVSKEECFADIHRRYNEHTSHDWCHTISNAMIVAASLIYGEGDYSKSICMAVETGFDTDCNGATVGSVLGMAYGTKAIDAAWTKPINDTLNTSVFGVGTVKISDIAQKTLEHMKS